MDALPDEELVKLELFPEDVEELEFVLALEAELASDGSLA
jgi:hypothetical protein